MSKIFRSTSTILDAKGATGWGTAIDIASHQHVVIEFSTAGSANLTIKFAGSIAQNKPDFTASQSASNHWDYVQVIDLNDGSLLDGDTGIVLAGTDEVRTLKLDASYIRWFSAHVTAHAAGSVTIKVTGTNND